MVVLNSPRGALLALCTLTLLYVSVVISGIKTPGHYLREVAEDPGPGQVNGSNFSTNTWRTTSRTALGTTCTTIYPKTSFKNVMSAKHPKVGAHIGLTPQRQDLLNMDVAIIVCYRDREIHLKIFVNYMNTFLQSQNSSARIYVIEQDGKSDFNRAKLFNVGYAEAKKDYNFTCFIFHDIDLIPENSKLIYQCGKQPLHLSAYIDKFNYKVPYNGIFGGVSGLSDEQMKKVNGFPNAYWGWGGEDDDLSKRIRHNGYRIHRPPAHLGRYTMMRNTGKHTQGRRNNGRFKLLREAIVNMPKDGISSLDYQVIDKVDYKTYIWILADLKRDGKLNPRPESESRNKKPVVTTTTKKPVVTTPTTKPVVTTPTTTPVVTTPTKKPVVTLPPITKPPVKQPPGS